MTTKETYQKIMKTLKTMENPLAVAGMARFGINPKNNLGIQVKILRQIAKETGADHALSELLWSSGTA
jgi:3-methyladenine DNA glycosylase AlkD